MGVGMIAPFEVSWQFMGWGVQSGSLERMFSIGEVCSCLFIIFF